jgi:hypothetical protein
MNHSTIEPLESRIAPASIIVNTLSDQIDSPGSHTISLRDAIAAANLSTHPTTILFKAGLTGEIALSSGASYGEFLITHPVTIIGPGPGKLTISANSSDSRIFDLEASASISGVSLIDGNGVGTNFDGSGGAIYSSHSLALSNVVISGCTTTGGKGGGVYIKENSPGVTVSVKSCVISGNTSDFGTGGIEIYASKSIQILNSVISGNTGASSSTDGGGLVADISPTGTGLSLSGDTIINNRGGNNTYGGGADLGSNGAPISLVNSTISGNTAGNRGGGLYLYQPTGKGIVSVTNTIVAGNNSGRYGGGIFARGGTKMNFSGVTVAGNQSSARGGGLYAEGNNSAVVTSVTGSHFVDNTASSNGGGIAINKNASLVLNGSTVSDNHANGGGGGIYITSNGNLTITGGAISSNFTSGVGGGIYAPFDGNVTITGTTLGHNVCNAPDGGGAILTNTSATVKLTGITVTGNDAIGYNGGGVFINASASTSKFDIIGGHFSGNVAGDNGGGIEITGIGSGKISGAVITGNIAVNAAGGLFNDLTTVSDLTLTGTTIAANTAAIAPNSLAI